MHQSFSVFIPVGYGTFAENPALYRAANVFRSSTVRSFHSGILRVFNSDWIAHMASVILSCSSVIYQVLLPLLSWIQKPLSMMVSILKSLPCRPQNPV